MALQFFRKHKKYFNILMIAAVFAMVTFGGLMYAGDAVDVFKNWMAGEDPRDPTVLLAYGQKITWSERRQVEVNCESGARFVEYVRYVSQFGGQKDVQAIAQTFRSSVMLYRYSAASQSGTPEDVRKVADATAVLMLEAKRAGIVVSDETIKNTVLSEWAAAGVTDQVLGGLVRQFFGGSTEVLYSVLRQELTLGLYLESIGQGATVTEQDVWAAYRNINQKAKVQTVDLKYETYLPKIAQPTEAEVEAQFAKYKSVLLDDPAAPFGYKIPNRVEFQYLTVDVKAIEADQQVTEEEIKKYYDENKDSRYVKPAAPAKPEPVKTGLTPADAEPTPDTPKTEAPKVDAPKADAPATDASVQPAKTLDAPEEPAAPVAADKPAEPAAAPAAEAAKADESPKAEDAAKTETPPVEAPKPEEKPKEYRPLDEVRDAIKTTLVKQKAEEEAQRLAAEAVNTLQTTPRMELVNVAGGKYKKVYGSKGLRTAAEIKDLPGVGKAYGYGRGKEAYTQISFADQVFSVEGLVAAPTVALNVVSDRILRDELGNRYLFVVTGTKAAEEPASLEQVKGNVVHDLQKVAAYREAEKMAERALDRAINTNLSIEAMQFLGTKPNSPIDIRRRETEYGEAAGQKLAKAVFEVVDAGGRFGTLGSETYDQVTVFEVLTVTLTTEADYARIRDSMVNLVLRTNVGNLLSSFTEPDQIIRRSGLVDVEMEVKKEKDTGERKTPKDPLML